MFCLVMSNITAFLAYIINSLSLFSFVLKKYCFKEYWIFPLLFPLKTALNHVVCVFHFRGSFSRVKFVGQNCESFSRVILLVQTRGPNSCVILVGFVGHLRLHRTSLRSVQIRSYFCSVFSCIRAKYGPEITPYLDTFHAMSTSLRSVSLFHDFKKKY